MNILAELKREFRQILSTMTLNVDEYLDMIHQSKRPGVDYQADFCMKLGRELGRPPREVVQEIVEQLE